MNRTVRTALCLVGLLLSLCVACTTTPTIAPPSESDTDLSKGSRGDISRSLVRHKPLVAITQSGDDLPLYGESHALLIGISDYDRWNKLSNIPAELDRVEIALKKEGFSITRLRNPDADVLRQVVSGFIGEHGYSPDNRLLLYYAGHGHSDAQQGYLVPRDAPRPGFDDSGFYRRAIAMGEVRAWAERIQAKHALFIFDSCFSGTVFSRAGSRSSSNYIRHVTSRGARQFITAGAANQVVPARSTFTPMFVEALTERKADLSGDGYVTGQELGLYLSEEVPKFEQRQNPQFGSLPDPRYSEGNFVFFGDKVHVTVEAPNERVSGMASDVTIPMLGTDGANSGSASPTQMIRQSFEPEMLIVPAGSFRMGNLDGGGIQRELPVHPVTLKSFSLATTEVTFTQYDVYVKATGAKRPDDEGWGRENRPVINVSWTDAKKYIDWLNKETGRHYRLPTESEWEYAARAGTESTYNWGNGIGHNNANCSACGSIWDNKMTAPVGRFAANIWGLYDIHGNVQEWVEDKYNWTYLAAPRDGSAQVSGYTNHRIVRGGAWNSVPTSLRSARRENVSAVRRRHNVGFRLAESIGR